VNRAQHDDAPAYEELVRRYQELAFRVAYTITRNLESAQDAVQSGFIKAYYALNRFNPDRPFRPWLLRIVTNEARNQVRSVQRRTEHELMLQRDQLMDDDASSPEAQTLATLSQERLLQVVNGLPPKDREVIASRYFLDLSEAETAAVLGCAPGTVKSRTSRALDRLRQRLAAPPVESLHE
jgi:RNA polymerase sigma factor (sigma-70 family)